jgi:hypothetical protein
VSILKMNPCTIQKQASACDQSINLSPPLSLTRARTHAQTYTRAQAHARTHTHTHTHMIMQLESGWMTLLSMPTSKTTRQAVYKTLYLYKHVIILANTYQNCIKINQFLILPHSKPPELKYGHVSIF